MAWDDAAERGAGCGGTGEVVDGVEAEVDVLEELVFHNDGYEGTHRFTPTGEKPAPARVFDCPAHWRLRLPRALVRPRLSSRPRAVPCRGP
jgi:hypothetical protein